MTVLQLKEALAGLPDGMSVCLNTVNQDNRAYDFIANSAFTVYGLLVLADEVPSVPKEVTGLLFPKEEA